MEARLKEEVATEWKDALYLIMRIEEATSVMDTRHGCNKIGWVCSGCESWSNSQAEVRAQLNRMFTSHRLRRSLLVASWHIDNRRSDTAVDKNLCLRQ
jgi:hypothetical protein